MPNVLTLQHPERCVACCCCMLACARMVNGSTHPLCSSLLVLPPASEFSQPLIKICQACPEPPCAEKCPDSALVPRPGGGVLFNAEKCSGCGQCARNCPVGVVSMWQAGDGQDKPVICRHCGACTRFCPQGVITMEVRENAQGVGY